MPSSVKDESLAVITIGLSVPTYDGGIAASVPAAGFSAKSAFAVLVALSDTFAPVGASSM